MTQFISAKKCATCYPQTIIQCKKLHRTCPLTSRKRWLVTLNPAFYETSQTWSYSSNIQLGTQDREQRHRTQNIDGMDFPTFLQPVITVQYTEQATCIKPLFGMNIKQKDLFSLFFCKDLTSFTFISTISPLL